MKQERASDAKRPYRMRARAEAAEETRRRILEAVTALFVERWLDQVSLDDVAARAGVTVQTVLRRFGSKDGLIAAAAAEGRREIETQRGQAPVGDIAGVIANLFDHYEAFGEIALRLLAQEGMHTALAEVTASGRQFHHAWAARTFAPQLARTPEPERERRRAQLTALTDVYTWKLLRRDLGLERDDAEMALRELIAGLPGMANELDELDETDETDAKGAGDAG